MIRRGHRQTHAGVAVALALLVGQLAAFLRLAIAPHEICLQHGELVERTRPSRGVVVAQQLGEAPTVSSTAVDNHAHDLCLTALVENDGADITVASAAIVLASSAHRARLFVAPSGERGSCVYRLAPKTSPPA